MSSAFKSQAIANMFDVNCDQIVDRDCVTSLRKMLRTQTGDGVILMIPRQFGNYTTQRVIGEGSSSVVIEAIDRRSGKDYAVKVMSVSALEQRNLLPLIERELAILRRVSHNHIIQFHDSLREGDLLFYVTENCTKGDLLSWIVDGHLSDKGTKKRLFHELALAVQYLHSSGIAHNDIKPENVLLDDAGHVKLADFGYAKDTLFAGDNEKNGTLMYAAPELLSPGTYHTQKADVWSLGITLYTMETGKFPFSGESERRLAAQIRNGQLKYPEGFDPVVEALLRKMTKVNPNKRATVDSVLEDPYFDEIRNDPAKKAAAVSQTLATQVEVEIEIGGDLW
jgi:serine/threonine protein kinase